jgi:cell division protein FtsL
MTIALMILWNLLKALRNPYVLYTVLILAAVGVVYTKGRIDAKNKAEVAALTKQRDALTHSIKVAEAVTKADKAQAAKDAAALSAYEDKVNELIAGTEDARTECLSSRDTGRLQQLWDGFGK